MLRFFVIFLFISICSYSQQSEYITAVSNKLRENKPRKAYRISKKFYKKHPADTSAIKLYAEQIENVFDRKRKSQIMKLYNDLIKSDTNNIHFYNMKITYLLRVEDIDNGMSLAKATLSRKKNLETYRVLALLYEDNQDTLNANVNFTEALRIDSNNAFLNYTIAQKAFYRPNYYMASKYFLKYIDLAKQNSIVINPTIIPDIIISLWFIDNKEKALYYWKLYANENQSYFNYRFNRDLVTKEMKTYFENNW